MASSKLQRTPSDRKTPQHFVSANGKAKSRLVHQISRLVRRGRLDYTKFVYVCQQVRRRLGLKRPQAPRKLPLLLPNAELKKFFQAITPCGNLLHEIMLKLLFFTAVRVHELVRIKVGDVNFEQCKIFVQQGKGAKDRYILFPENFRLVLQSHLQANPENRYLFETTRCTPFTTRRVQQIVQHYRSQAGIEQPVHPHLFRHQMITFLTSQGLSDSQIQLISGHQSKKSLEIYQHLSLKDVHEPYQTALKALNL